MVRGFPIEPRSTRAAIGSRLREVRKARGLTVDQLASELGVNRSHLSRIERDLTSPSVSMLVKICDALTLDVGDLFRQSDVEVIRGATAPQIMLGGEGVREVLVSPRLENRVQVIRSSIAPGVLGSGGSELYTVSAELDVLHVIAGNVRVRFADGEYVLGAGDTISLDGREPHTWNVEDSFGAELIWVLVSTS